MRNLSVLQQWQMAPPRTTKRSQLARRQPGTRLDQTECRLQVIRTRSGGTVTGEVAVSRGEVEDELQQRHRLDALEDDTHREVEDLQCDSSQHEENPVNPHSRE